MKKINQDYQSTEYKEIINERYNKKIDSTEKYAVTGAGILGMVIGLIGCVSTGIMSLHSPENEEICKYIALGGPGFALLSTWVGAINITRLSNKLNKKIQDLEGTVSN